MNGISAVKKQKGFTLIEIMVVIFLLGIVISLIFPSYRASREIAARSACIAQQKAVSSAIQMWQVENRKDFVTPQDGFGSGEVFINSDGSVVGDSERNLAPYLGGKLIECPSSDGESEPHYVTDGNRVACLHDGFIDVKSDGSFFENDIPRSISLNHLPEDISFKSSSASESHNDDTYFTDNFKEGDFNWKKVVGKYWNIDDEALTIGKEGVWGGEHRIFSGSEDWTDYTIEVDANLKEGWGYGVYFRATDIENANAYVFQYDPGYGSGAFILRKITDGKESPPFAVTYFDKSPFKKESNDNKSWWYDTIRKVTIEVKKDQFTVYIDGKKVVKGKDSDYSSGMIGFRTWNQSYGTFDNVVVKPIK